MKTIVNDEKSFNKIVKFCKTYFENVRIVKNKFSGVAKRSFNFYIIILFENRGQTFSIKWNYKYSVIFLGDITKNKKISLQYQFTKMAFNSSYPIEEGNNYNIMFWECEFLSEFNNTNTILSPLRIPINLK